MSANAETDATIRAAEVGDAGAIARIVSEELGYPASSEAVALSLARLLPDAGNLVLVIVREGRVIGYGHAAPKPSLWIGLVAELQTFAIEKQWQGRGYGARLLSEFESRLAAAGYEYLKLGSRSEREGAHRFYDAQGYTREKISVRFSKHLKPASHIPGLKP
jgi:ribosomal protein S18 acetylase RimI-like enzyme